MEISKLSYTYSHRFDAQQPQEVTVDPSILFFSDIDDTFVPWKKYNQEAEVDKLERTQASLQSYKGETVNALCSARGLSSVQKLIPYLKDMPLQILGTNGGQQVFVNHQNIPTEQWLSALSVTDSDYGWQQEVSQRSGGFSTQAAMENLKDVLKDLGFEKSRKKLPKPLDDREVYLTILPGKAQEVAVVALSPDQSSFMIRANPTRLDHPVSHQHRQLGRRIAYEMEKRMLGQGIDMEAKRFISDSEHLIYLLQPHNVDKQNLLEHLLGRYPAITSVITAGDHINDTMLGPSTYGDVANYRIISGDRPEVVDQFSGQANVEQVPKGELSQGLESHMARLLAEPD